MTRKTKAEGAIQRALRELAMRYPGAEEAIACEGTAVESSAFKARKKTFLFVNAKHVRLKLRESLAEATTLAAKEPARYEAGSLGWIKLTLGPDPDPPLELLERWIDESHRIVVGGTTAVKLVAKKKAAKPAAKKGATARRG